jgi:hypothetical protein
MHKRRKECSSGKRGRLQTKKMKQISRAERQPLLSSLDKSRIRCCWIGFSGLAGLAEKLTVMEKRN